MPMDLRDLDAYTYLLLLDELRADLHQAPIGRVADAALFAALLREVRPEHVDPSGLHPITNLLPTRAITTKGVHPWQRFQHYYLRAVCRRAVQLGAPHVVLYCATTGAPPSHPLHDLSLCPEALLADLRHEARLATVPGGPYAGLCACLPPAWRRDQAALRLSEPQLAAA
jgi:hypothetical protein